MFNNPFVYPCREAIVETARAVRDEIRGDHESAQAHVAVADEAQRAAQERGTNRKEQAA